MQNTDKVSLELQQVKKFLAESQEFKKLQEVAAAAKPTVFRDGNVPERPESQIMVENINKCKTFSELFEAMAIRKDLPSPIVMIPATFVLGFFDQSANIGYYTLLFKMKVEDKMKELGYTANARPSSYRPSSP